MIPIARLKRDLVFSKSLSVIIDILKIGASIRLQQFQLKERICEEFTDKLKECFKLLESKKTQHPLLHYSEGLPTCIVVITSDEGFLGGLNTLLINASLEQRKGKDDQIVVLGERGSRYLQDIGESYLAFPGITEDINHHEVEGLKKYLIRKYKSGKFGKVVIIYAKFFTISLQRVEVERILPCLSLIKETNKYEFRNRCELSLLEPSLNKIIDGLASLWLTASIYNIFWSSKFSEFAARLMHLEGSNEELSHIKQELSLQYFRHLHALTDKSIREILASRLIGRG